MNVNYNKFILTGLILVTAGLLQPVAGTMIQPATVSPNQAPTATIGLLSPQTGSLSQYATQFENAANLAIDKLNSLGLGYNFVLDIRDSATNPTTTQTEAQSLISGGVIGIVGPAESASLVALESIASSNTVPIISGSATSPHISELNDNGYIFSVAAPEDTQGNATAKLLNHFGYSEVVILWDSSSTWNQDMADHMAQEFIGDSTILEYDDGTDTSALLSSFPNSADALYITGFDSTGVIVNLFEQMEAANTEIDVFGDVIVKNAHDLASAAVQTYLDGSFYMEYQSEFSSYFTNDYINAYATNPTGQNFTGEYYDAVYIMGQAYASVGSSGAALRDEILTMELSSASGYIDFNSKGTLEYFRWPYFQISFGTWEDRGNWDYFSFEFDNNIHVPYIEERTTVTDRVTETETTTTTSERIITNSKSDASLNGPALYISALLFVIIGVQRRYRRKD